MQELYSLKKPFSEEKIHGTLIDFSGDKALDGFTKLQKMALELSGLIRSDGVYP